MSDFKKESNSVDSTFGSFKKKPKQKASKLPLAFLCSLLIPTSYYLGSIRLTFFMILLILCFFPMLYIWLSGRSGKMTLPDTLILLSAVFSSIALVTNNGLSESVEPAGVLILQTVGSYLVGRCFVRNYATLLAIFRLQFILILLIFPFAMAETLTGNAYLMRVLSALGQVPPDVQIGARMGLNRVQGPFEHPILFGLFVSSGFAALFMTSKTVGQIFRSVTIFISTVFSVSTGALVCWAVQVIILFWGYLFRSNPKRWRNLFLLFLLAYISIDLLSNRSPFAVFVDYIALGSGQSAYNRILIWKYGTAEIWRHPILGIGLNDWQRPRWMSSSMDNFWLLIAVRYGLPAWATLSGAVFLILYRAGQKEGINEKEKALRQGVLISIIGLCIAAGSAHLWNAIFCWFMLLVGSIAWLAEPEVKQKKSVLIK